MSIEINLWETIALPLFRFCFLLIITGIAVALLTRKHKIRMYALLGVCLMGGIGLAMASHLGWIPILTFPGAALLLISFGVGIGRYGGSL